MTSRLDPFEFVFGAMAPERFTGLQQGLERAGRDPRDRDQFVLVREVVELLRELAPDDSLGEGVRQLVGLVHASYLYWLDGRRRMEIDRPILDRLLGGPASGATVPSVACYVALAPRRVWGMAIEGGPAEPLDGLFALPSRGNLAVLGVFGLHPGRTGFTVVEAVGPRIPALARADGSPLFSPKLSGGREAGLYQILGEDELLELGYRIASLP